MLDKDQYNQEEYNSYYQQESQGAEIKGAPSEKPKGKGALLALLALLLLGGGYFGYTQFMVSDPECATPELTNSNTQKEEKKAVEKEETVSSAIEQPVVQTPQKSKETNVEESVKTAVGENQKMSPEEIAKVVQMVMLQMNTKPSETVSNDKKTDEIDNELMSALSGTDVDTVSEEVDLEKVFIQADNSKDVTIQKTTTEVNTYNKINVQNNSGDDELSKLSGQISELISNKKSTTEDISSSSDEKNYTENLKKEVVTRKNEMRIIVVKKGDTLGKIAKRAYGNVMEFKKIYQANPDMLNRPDRIYIGQKLRIPK